MTDVKLTRRDFIKSNAVAAVLIFSILQLFFIHALFGQFTAPALSFLNSKPLWTYIPQDTNFEFSPQDPWYTPYSNKNSWRLDIQNGNIYLFQSSSTQNTYLGHDGFILHQLDLSSGTATWSLHNNYNSGLTHREYYFSSHFEYTNDSKLKIIDLKDFEPLDTTKPNFFFYGKPFIKTIDLQSGRIDNMIESTATKHSQLYSSTGYGTFNRYTRIGEQYYTFISNAYIERVRRDRQRWRLTARDVHIAPTRASPHQPTSNPGALNGG